jgi:hypothetical protein
MCLQKYNFEINQDRSSESIQFVKKLVPLKLRGGEPATRNKSWSGFLRVRNPTSAIPESCLGTSKDILLNEVGASPLTSR